MVNFRRSVATTRRRSPDERSQPILRTRFSQNQRPLCAISSRASGLLGWRPEPPLARRPRLGGEVERNCVLREERCDLAPFPVAKCRFSGSQWPAGGGVVIYEHA